MKAVPCIVMIMLLIMFVPFLPPRGMIPAATASMTTIQANEDHDWLHQFSGSNDHPPKKEQHLVAQQQSANYSPLFIDGLAVVGWPYYQPFFPESNNVTLTYSLDANRTYLGFLFGDYLGKQVDLDLWLMWFNSTSNQSELLEFTTNHDLGSQDDLRFTIPRDGNYSIVIYNHASFEEFPYIGFVLLEEVTSEENMTIFLEKPEILPLEKIPRYHTHHGLFIPWKEAYQDVNMTITIHSADTPLTINASVYPAFRTNDLLVYDPFLPEGSRHAADTRTIMTNSRQNSLSILLGPREQNWMEVPGIIVFVEAINGTGTMTLGITTTRQFDISHVTPIGFPQVFTLNQTTDFFTISYYFNSSISHDAFLWIVSPQISENDKPLAKSVNIQLWRGSPLEAEENWRDPTKVPFLLEESSTTVKHIENFKVPSTGRYTFVVYLDLNGVNITSPLTVVFNVFERWDLARAQTKEFSITARNPLDPSAYTLNSFKTFFIPIRHWEGKNITFHVTIPPTLEVEAQLHPFTTTSQQLTFSPFTHEAAIMWEKGLNEEITLFSQVGRRNKDKVNDTFWVLSIIGITGSGTVHISWTEANVPINWVDLGMTGTILMACVVIIIIFAWKGEKYLYSF